MIKITIFDHLAKLGYTSIDQQYYGKIDEWYHWYQGDVTKFHHYSVYNGEAHVRRRRATLNMAKKVCEDWANLLLNEKVTLTLDGAEKEQAFLSKVLQDNNFWIKANEAQELKMALGTVAYIPFADKVMVDSGTGAVLGGGSVKINYVDAYNIYPLAWENGKITECAFTSSVIKPGGDGKAVSYLFLQSHVLDNGLYKIQNEIFEQSQTGLKIVPLESVPGFNDIAPTINTNSSQRQFVIDRPNIVNNLEIGNNPLGISVFANSIDVLKGIDLVYDSYNNEFELGKKRIMVSEEATQKMMSGQSVFDPNDLVYYRVPGSESDDKTYIQAIDMTLRSTEHESALESRLNLLSSKCGFGENHYQFNRGGVSTATQIISENSSMFQTLKKHEIILEGVLKELVKIILAIGRDILKEPLNPDVTAKIDFDDSIIEDKDVQFQRDLQLVRDGIMPKWEFRMRHLHEDEETAKKMSGAQLSNDEIMGF